MSLPTLAIALLCAGIMGLLALSVVAAQSIPTVTPDAPTISVAATGTAGELEVTVTPATSGGDPTSYEARTCATGTSHCTAGADDGAAGWGAAADLTLITLNDVMEGTISGLTDGTAYAVEVRAVNSGGASPWSNLANGTPVVGPGTPTISVAPTGTAGSSKSQ